MIMNNKGFTIVELVIAIFIIVFAVVGVYNAFSLIVVLTSGAKDNLTAAYLAQEGIEVIRNIRDQNWLDDINWDDTIVNCALGCEPDYTSTTDFLKPWPTGGDFLYVDSNGFYNYSENGTATKFKRKITVTEVENVSLNMTILKVKSEVFWNDRGKDFSISAQEDLYNWY